MSPQTSLEAISDSIKQPSKHRFWSNAFQRIIKDKASLLGLCIILIVIITAIFAPIIATHNPIDQQIMNRYQPPSMEHFFGTDALGRDVFSRIVYGSRITLQIGVVAVSISMTVGIFLGVISGYFGKWTDLIIMRVIDILMAFPGILLAIALVAILGPSLRNAIIAIGIIGIPHFARVVRSAVISVKEAEYIEAARAIGNKHNKIITRHILVNCTAPIIVQTTVSLGLAILEATGLSFLGLGAQAPLPEWGAMLNDGRAAMDISPWLIAFPGLAIFLIVLAFNMLGDGLRNALDPKLIE